MNADTESNVDTARSRAERLIEQGANVLVGAFDSGHTAAIAQVAEQRGVPLIVNIAAAPQITEQGYKFVFRNSRPRPRSAATGWCCWATSFARRRSNRRPRCSCTSTTHSASRWPRASRRSCPRCRSPFKLLDTIPYDPAAKDLNVEVSRAKATNAELLLLVCRLNDAIVLRREMVKQRWSPMGVVSPGSPASTRSSSAKAREIRRLLHHEHGLVQSQERDHARVRGGVQEALPQGRVRLSRHQRQLHVRRPPDRRRRLQAREEHRSQGARRCHPADEHPGDRSGHLRRAYQVQREGPGRRRRVDGDPEPKGKPTVVLPKEYSEGKLVFPMPKAG